MDWYTTIQVAFAFAGAIGSVITILCAPIAWIISWKVAGINRATDMTTEIAKVGAVLFLLGLLGFYTIAIAFSDETSHVLRSTQHYQFCEKQCLYFNGKEVE